VFEIVKASDIQAVLSNPAYMVELERIRRTYIPKSRWPRVFEWTDCNLHCFNLLIHLTWINEIHWILRQNLVFILISSFLFEVIMIKGTRCHEERTFLVTYQFCSINYKNDVDNSIFATYILTHFFKDLIHHFKISSQVKYNGEA
jgi:hypothetical protein